jgi:pilus assembly protein CpaF
MNLEKALGPLSKLYNDSYEIIVDSYDDVYVETKKGELKDVENIFKNDTEVEQVIRNLMKLASVEFKSDIYNYDFTVNKQTRVNIISPPMSHKGPAFNLITVPEQSLTWKHMREWNVVREEGEKIIKDAIAAGKNLLVAGSAGSGKTTLMNICASSIDPAWRVVSIERTPSLLMDRKRHARLMAPNNKVEEMVSLVEAAGKARADYLVHAYVEGPETIAFMELVREGSSAMALVSGENIFDAIKGLEFKALSCNYGRSIEDIRYTIANSFDLIIFQEKMEDNSRKITRIASISYDEGKVKLDVLYTH